MNSVDSTDDIRIQFIIGMYNCGEVDAKAVLQDPEYIVTERMAAAIVGDDETLIGKVFSL